MPVRARRWPLWLLASAFLLTVSDGRAACNVIPAARSSFRSTLGAADRPFARPGDWVTITLDSACHAESAGFGAQAADNQVSIVFTPAGGPPTALVFRESCADFDGSSDAGACQAQLGSGRVACLRLSAINPPLGIDVVNARTLRFRFPDTDALLLEQNDDLTLAGPATIAVTRAGSSPACRRGCANQAGLVACVDRFFSEGTCGDEPLATFPSFTALPPPNDYQSICTEPVPPCQPVADRELRFAIDAGGSILAPMDWRGILVRRDAVPVARLLRWSASVESVEGRGAPILIPDLKVLSSFSPEGIRLPPLFEPQADASAMDAATFFGSADAPETVLRIARHDRAHRQCTDGSNAGLPCRSDAECPVGTCTAPRCAGGDAAGAACVSDAECPAGECGPGLFDFSTRLAAGGGPVVLRLGACIGGANALASCTDDTGCPGGQCGTFAAKALDPVPLDGLNQSASLNAFVAEEAITERDLNGDADVSDHVVTVNARATGILEPIGVGGATGRAVVRVAEPPFTFPAVAVEDELLAFLEPEPQQGRVDANGNGNVFDMIVRIFRIGGAAPTDRLPGQSLAADAAPLFDGRSLAVSGGRVFFRASEAARVRQTTTRVSVAADGGQASGASNTPTLSADGRFVRFWSDAGDLTSDPVAPGTLRPYVRDRDTDGDGVFDEPGASATLLISIPGDAACPDFSEDRRWVAFSSEEPGGLDDVDFSPAFDGAPSDVFLFDRDADGDGLFDELGPGGTSLQLISKGDQFGRGAYCPQISGDGRFILFGHAPDLDNEPVALYDRDADEDGVLDGAAPGATRLQSIGLGDTPFGISANGLFGFIYDAYSVITAEPVVLDLRTGETAPVVPRVDGFTTFAAGLSDDGRLVLLNAEDAVNLVPGDTNGRPDAFVRDRLTGETAQASLGADGASASKASLGVALSRDGRLVTLASGADLVGDATLDEGFDVCPNVYLHDSLTAATTLAAHVTGAPNGNCRDSDATMTPDGRWVAFSSDDLARPDDTNGLRDVFVRGPDPADAVAVDATLFPDGTADDTVLQVFDDATGTLATLCPAEAVAVAVGRATFLRPEASTSASATCPAGPLNADGDVADRVVQCWAGAGAAQNLARAATKIAMSTDWLAALVSEGGDDVSYNADADTADTVAQIHRVCGGDWVNVGQAADAIGVDGSLVVFTTPEAGEDGADLNGDGDAADRVLRVFDADTGALADMGQAAEDFVVGGGRIVAFRTREAAQGGVDLNGDGDTSDDVLQAYDAACGRVLNTGQAVTPCRLEACDPRTPYRVLGDTVRFLTFECDQKGPNHAGCEAGGTDLDGDGDAGDLVLQVLNVRRACASGDMVEARHVLASVSAGICTNTGRACASDAACDAPSCEGSRCHGTCFLPPGGCVADTGTVCRLPCSGEDCPQPEPCPAGQYCQPDQDGAGTCHEVLGPCRSTADCQAFSPDAVCNEGAQQFNRLASPLTAAAGTDVVVTSGGRCVEQLATACTERRGCGAGEYCEQGRCRRDHGSCRADADCPSGATCVQDLTTQTAHDADADELPDVVDNCPGAANILQEDADGDRVGDACDPQTCGNGRRESTEACDASDLGGCPGSCRGDCSCAPCTDVEPAQTRISLKRGRRLRARLRVALGDYAGEPLRIEVAGAASDVIVAGEVTPRPKGRKGRVWRFAHPGAGIQRAIVKQLRGTSGTYLVKIRGRRTGTGSGDQPLSLVLGVNGRCFIGRSASD